ncbi:hypothetical protein J5Y09_04110 [Roseomonas sp. PWR1]|uniref:Uncharacterized protein n=1 Tax=Roseomonas nitratireducens TaxID=2820810 RepID=A0ABS4ANZ4_9PROT|nr:hypothetical protein [Neoroseomonas nitratireducens]MBP0463085.1 hypothetical protein [Neoroseomonas nitratireducens]
MSETTPTPEARSPEALEGELIETTRQLQQMRWSDPARPALLAKRDLLSAEQVAAKEAEAQPAEPDFSRTLVAAARLGLPKAEIEEGSGHLARYLGDDAHGRAIASDIEYLRHRGDAQADRNMKALRALWGRDYDANLSAVRAEVARHPGFADWLDRTGAANSPTLANQILLSIRRAK